MTVNIIMISCLVYNTVQYYILINFRYYNCCTGASW